MIHTERYSVPAATLDVCLAAERVVAVGTTVVRALESAASTGRLSGRTDLFIYGGHSFRVVDVLVTNFHLPRSSLLLLVEAFLRAGSGVSAVRRRPGRRDTASRRSGTRAMVLGRAASEGCAEVGIRYTRSGSNPGR